MTTRVDSTTCAPDAVARGGCVKAGQACWGCSATPYWYCYYYLRAIRKRTSCSPTALSSPRHSHCVVLICTAAATVYCKPLSPQSIFSNIRRLSRGLPTHVALSSLAKPQLLHLHNLLTATDRQRLEAIYIYYMRLP